MAVLFVDDFIVDGNGIFSRPIPHGADIMQEPTLFIEKFEGGAFLPYPDILVGGKGEPGFKHSFVGVVEMYDSTVVDKFAERHVDGIFREGEVAHGQFVPVCFNSGDTSVVCFLRLLFPGGGVAC